ncbi:hypothetical protein Taro_027885 [Colocasia esculenta]|uniref:G-patch domain-containing protein n=1 Tax=Colocasia esculenta TaxID=4460 RepID=A0A843VJD3_COLES|nr:hypothetical protein [Colocasia esculenta]
MAGEEGNEEGDDYMGDLSLFIPQELSSSSSSSSSCRKSSSATAPAIHPPKPKRTKGISWQEQRKLDRERKQREEDERTMAGLETAIPSTNVGFKLLQQMGYSPGSALGKGGAGRSEPVGLEIRRSRAGIGKLSPGEERARKERDLAERKRRGEENLMQEFGSRQKTQWKSRRIVADYRKADAALAQLENREVVEPEGDGEDEEKKPEEEEEEEEITEEDLQNVLMKLRNEHQYCLYCGCKYESVEALETNCPGLNEDDH